MSRRPLLGINVDHVATIRQARGTRYPRPLQAAREALAGGADSITVHLREDRRHIQEQDVADMLRELPAPLNLELSLSPEMIRIAEKLRPAYCCIVPERRRELTTEGGVDVILLIERVQQACRRLAAAGIRTSLFIDALPGQVEAAAESGSSAIELHTGSYAEMEGLEQERELARLASAAKQGIEAGLQVHAGHGLHLRNTLPVARVPQITELNIGHSIVARALFTGMHTAVAEMRALLDQVQP